MKSYGKVIAKLRKEKGLTQEALGKQLNVSYQAVSKWENDLSEPDIATLREMVKIFGISILDFFDMVEEKPVQTVAKPLTIEKRKLSSVHYIMIALLAVICILSLIVALIPKALSANDVYTKVNPSVVCITINTPKQIKSGSGFFIDRSGTIVTNYHVIQDGTDGKVTLANGEEYDIINVVGANEDNDIAIIQIDKKGTSAVSLGNSNHIAVGDVVYAIGYPNSFELGKQDSTLTEGIISKTSYNIEGKNYIQTTTNITSGNSGGVLVNNKGEVIGITTGAINLAGVDYMNLAIPINQLNTVERDKNMPLEDYTNSHYTVKYYSDNSLVFEADVFSGDTLNERELNKDGYKFLGWYTDNEYTYKFDFNQAITSDLSLFAKWEAIKYTISFLPNGGDGVMEDITLSYDETIYLPENKYTLVGKGFTYWKVVNSENTFLDKAQIKNLTTEDNTLIELEAQWEDLIYAITFDGNGATSGTMLNQYINYGQTASLAKNQFTKVGYTFSGWSFNNKTYLDTQEVYNLTDTQKSITLKAIWTPITYTVQFGKYTVYGTQTFTYDEPQSLTLFDGEVATGYKLIGWTYNGTHYTDGQEVLNLTATDGDVLVFEEELQRITYYIDFNPNGGEGEITSQEFVYNTGSQLKKQYFTMVGHHIAGWTDADGNEYSTTEYIRNLTSIDNARITFYANWQPNTYYIYFSSDEEYEGFMNGIEVEYNERINLPANTLEKTGYTFVRWECLRISSPYNYFVGYFEDEAEIYNLTAQDGYRYGMFAEWTPNKYNLVFDPNGGEGKPQTLVMSYDGTYTVSNTPKFTRENYIFKGWQYEDTYYKVGSKITNLTTTPNDTINLYAIWVPVLDGEGTDTNPYIIDSLEKLNALWLLLKLDEDVENTKEVYKLTCDIDVNGGQLNSIENLYGTFDGGGHTIKNFKLKADSENVGFIERSEGILKNLNLENVTIEASDIKNLRVGALIGFMYSGRLQDCSVKDVNISINNATEIKAGLAIGTTNMFSNNIQNILAISGTIDITNVSTGYVGGLAGDYTISDFFSNDGDGLNNTYANATININNDSSITTQKLYVGGLAGSVSRLSSSFAISNINVDIASCANVSDIKVSAFMGSEHNTYDYCYYSDISSVSLKINGEVQDAITSNATMTLDANLKDINWLQTNSSFGRGDWTCENGYPTFIYNPEVVEINSLEEFLALNNTYLSKSYKLNCDIDLTGVDFIINENNFVFDGGGHTISNITISQLSDKNIGLFRVNSGTIKNLILDNVVIDYIGEPLVNVGGLVGCNKGTITTCVVDNSTITVDTYDMYVLVGGLVGENYGSVSNSHVDVDITINNTSTLYAGGIVGYGGGTTVQNCYTEGHITINTTKGSVYSAGVQYFRNTLNCFSLMGMTIDCGSGSSYTYFVSLDDTRNYAWSGQEKIINGNSITAKGLTKAQLCSKTFLTELGYGEYVSEEDLVLNESNVWVISGTDLPKLYFEK